MSWTVRHSVVLLLLTAIAVTLQATLLHWYIEDAAISFAFARNWAQGEGLVAWAGGERVEGYSNPTWVALMALFQLVGIDGFASSKAMGLTFAAVTVPLVAAIARKARPDRPDMALYAAAFLAGNTQFAIWGGSGLENSLLNLGLAAGMYRSLVEQEKGRWPLAPLIWLVVALTRPEGIAYAALAGFWQLVWNLADGRGIGPSVVWLLVFFAPWTAYNAVRYEYFAWWWPNTYYAKEDAGDFQPWLWGGKGWKYIRTWAFDLGQAWLLPVYLAGVLSLKRWRGVLAVMLLIALCFALLPGSQIPSSHPLGDTLHPWLWKRIGRSWAVPVGGIAIVGVATFVAAVVRRAQDARATSWLDVPIVTARSVLAVGLPVLLFAQWYRVVKLPFVTDLQLGKAVLWLPFEVPGWHPTANGLRVVIVFAVALLAPLFAVGRPNWRVPVFAWHLATFALFFALWSGGDWMKQFRWMASLAVPASVLLAAGLAEAQDRLQWRYGGAWRESKWTWPAHSVGLALLVAYGVVNGHNLARFINKPETGPYSVKNRVAYKQGVAERLHIEGPIVDLDVDQGAHLWWSGFHMLDIAGLVDVPMAHHEHEIAFMKEYLFVEQRPHFAHVHGGWAGTSRIPQIPEWKTEYFEIPGYGGPNAKTLHIGNHVRKDLFADPAGSWTAPEGAPETRVEFEQDIVLEGLVVPSSVAGQGMTWFVEVGLSSPRDRGIDETFRVLLFLVDDAGHALTWDAPVGYDWYDPGDWLPNEVFHGRYAFPIPVDTAPGAYRVGVYVLARDGHVLRPVGGVVPDGAVAGGLLPAFPAKVIVGEVVFPLSIEIATKEAVAARSSADLDTARTQAGAGECEAAEASYRLAKRRNSGDDAWEDAALAAVSPAIAACWARKVEPALHADQVAWLARARRWDHHEPVVLAAAAPLADAWFAEGLAARERKDWEAAYRAFSDVLVADPLRSWARRYAEEARDHRLGLDKKPATAGKGGKPGKGGAKGDRLRPRVPRPGAILPNGLELPADDDVPAPSGPDEAAPDVIPDDGPPAGPEPEQ